MNPTQQNPYPPHQEPPPAGPPPGGPGWSDRPSRDLDPRRKSVAAACLLSALPGLGQVYVGYYRVGFFHIATVGAVISLMAGNFARGVEPLFGLFLAFFWLYNIIDAGRRAMHVNMALSGIGGLELPSEIGAVHGRGSLFGGLALIVLGCVFLSNTLFDISLEWLEDWWPVAPIAVGAWLVFESWRERDAAKADGKS